MVQEEKLEEAKRLYKDANEAQRYVLELLFPELRGLENERIIHSLKEIVTYAFSKKGNEVLVSIDGLKKDDLIEWLENQSEWKSDNSYCQENCKGFQETGKCFADGDCKAKREAEIIDKLESKFKIEEGKWYVCTQTYVLRGKIIVIKGQTYQAEQDNVIKGEDECLFIDRHDGKASDYFRSWTIQDAKDGDVLANDHNILILKELDYNWSSNGKPSAVKAYCGIKPNGNFEIGKENWCFCGTLHIHPATKEQRDLLFQKMKEAGYEWNDEKKKLNKIEQNVVLGEEDEENLKDLIDCLKSIKQIIKEE